MPYTRAQYDSLHAKLIRTLTEAEERAANTRKKLEALQVLEGELLEDEAVVTDPSNAVDTNPADQPEAKSVTVEELVTLLQEAPNTFTHIIITELAAARYGLVSPRSVRIGLNRLANRNSSPIEITEVGKGQRPTVFRKREEESQIFS